MKYVVKETNDHQYPYVLVGVFDKYDESDIKEIPLYFSNDDVFINIIRYNFAKEERKSVKPMIIDEQSLELGYDLRLYYFKSAHKSHLEFIETQNEMGYDIMYRISDELEELLSTVKS